MGGGVTEWDPVFATLLAARVICSVAFGQGIAAEDAQQILNKFSSLGVANSSPWYRIRGYIDLPLPGPRAVRKAIKGVHEIAQKFIAKERATNNLDESECSTLLSVLVHACDDCGAQLDEEELVHNVYAFFGAGIATTSHSLCSTLFMLARHPEVQSKLQQELTGVELEWESVKSLPFLSAVITESLRLCPPFTNLPARILTEEVELPGGVHAGKGVQVGVDILAHQRRPAMWGSDADEFRPERFLIGQGEKGVANPMMPHKMPPGVPDSSFPVFGYGVRPCIGRPLAIIELKMAVAHTLRRFTVEEMEPDKFEMVKASVGFSPKRGLKLRLRQR